MKKVAEFIVEHINKAIGGVVVLGLGYFASLGYWFCKLLGVNSIYCDPIFIRYELFLIGGVLISICGALISKWRWWWFSTALFCVAVLFAIILPIISHLASLPRAPEEIIEFKLVVPFQIVIGLIIGQILIWIWTYFGSVFKEWLRKRLGLMSGTVEEDGTGSS
jgi:hypothetical protein